MNIFETIAKVTTRVEPFHSQFLADALDASIKGDRSLFDAVWKLAAPPDWEAPCEARISSEEVVDTGRIDVCISCEHPRKRIVGIEVKTVEHSAETGQLEKYRVGLTKKFRKYEVQISYLTPFNRERAGDAVNLLHTVKEFEEFARSFPRSRHLSWLDVADISWDSNELWRQHQSHVRESISSRQALSKRLELNRGFAEFFGEEAAARFLGKFEQIGVSGTEVNLSELGGLTSVSGLLIDALEPLLNADSVSRNVNREDRFSNDLRQKFLTSPYHEVHEALFGLSALYSHVWVQGKRDYAVRTAHRKHSSGVSLLRSDGPERLVVGQRR